MRFDAEKRSFQVNPNVLTNIGAQQSGGDVERRGNEAIRSISGRSKACGKCGGSIVSSGDMGVYRFRRGYGDGTSGRMRPAS